MRTNETYTFPNNIELKPYYSIPNTYLQNELSKFNESAITKDMINSFLIVKDKIKKKHSTDNNKILKKHISYDDLDNLRLLLPLSSGYGVQAVGYATIVSDDIPMLTEICWRKKDFRSTRVGPNYIRMYAKNASLYFNNFLKMRTQKQRKLLITLKKLNDYYSTYDSVQSAIDLRTAYETFLSQKKEDNMSKSMFSNRLIILSDKIDLGKENIEKDSKMLYKICSEAIHTGKIPTSRNLKLLDEFSLILSKLIVLVFKNELDFPFIFNSTAPKVRPCTSGIIRKSKN